MQTKPIIIMNSFQNNYKEGLQIIKEIENERNVELRCCNNNAEVAIVVKKYSDKVQKIMNNILENDVRTRYANGKAINFTPSIKSQVKDEVKYLTDIGFIKPIHGACNCIVCAKKFNMGDLLLADERETSFVCIDCTDEGNILKSQEHVRVLA